MVLSSYITVDGRLTTFRISQNPIASFLRQSDQNQNQSKNKFLGFGLGQRLAIALNLECIALPCLVSNIGHTYFDILVAKYINVD